MRARISFLPVAVATMLALIAGCNVILGLEPANLYAVDGGATGSASTSTGSSASGSSTSTASSSTSTASSTTSSGMTCGMGAVVACYDGPSGTEGVGSCKAGTAVCGASGVPGPCMNEVLPTTETCANSADENCDGYDCVEYARIFGDTSTQEPLGVAVDANGNAYVAGRFGGSIQVDKVTLVEAGGSTNAINGFLIAFDPNGHALWGNNIGDKGDTMLTAIALDPGGYLIVGGQTGSAIMWGNFMISPGLFVGKLKMDGTPVWITSIQGDTSSLTVLNSVAVAPDSGVLCAGAFLGSVDFGDGPISSNPGLLNMGTDGFVARLRGSDGSGKAADGGWSKTFGDDNAQAAQGVGTDAGGNVYVAGSFEGTINLGGIPLTSSGDNDVLLAKFDPMGGWTWQKQFGDASDQQVTGFAVDTTGTTVIAGKFQGAINFGSANVQTTGTALFAAEFSNSSTALWAQSFASGGSVVAAFDGQGDAILAGGFTGNIKLGTGMLTASGSADDVFLAKLNSMGAAAWSKRFGDSEEQAARAVAALPSGESIVVGVANGATDFGTGTLTSNGAWDGFVAKFGQ